MESRVGVEARLKANGFGGLPSEFRVFQAGAIEFKAFGAQEIRECKACLFPDDPPDAGGAEFAKEGQAPDMEFGVEKHFFGAEPGQQVFFGIRAGPFVFTGKNLQLGRGGVCDPESVLAGAPGQPEQHSGK